MREASVLDRIFQNLRWEGAAALLPYFVADFPDPRTFGDCLRGAEDADAIEVGIPFSDPIADGPTIRAAARRSLEQGTSVPRVLETLEGLRGRIPAPPILMTYLNPLLSYGLPRFFRDAAGAGVAGVIVPDLPLEASGEPGASNRGVDLVLLAAPTTPPARLRKIAAATRGFLYLVSRAGTTGVRKETPPGLVPYVARARAAARAAGRPALPLIVGFGVGGPRSAASIARAADGVVVGSALVEALGRDGRARALALLGSIRRALDAARLPRVPG